jgi:hypothetical protein
MAMTTAHAGFERRAFSALDAGPSRIPVILGGCGTGRTSLLYRLRDRAGRDAAQYIDVERCATTPERFFAAVTAASPFRWQPAGTPGTAREAFDMLVAFFEGARSAGGESCTFLLDEVLELRTFESFPGLRHVLRDLLVALSGSSNRFVLTTRYTARAHRLLRDATSRFEVMHVPPLSAGEVTAMMAPAFNGYEQMATEDRDYLGRAVLTLTDGRTAYVEVMASAMAHSGGIPDPVAALATLLASGAPLDGWCQFCYELRLHRARGYGALKAILDILAGEEPLTLTEISQRLRRTPGYTKDYLSWLEDVDLVTSRQKRYSFSDPVLRLWVRLHCRPAAPDMDVVMQEVQRYAAARLPKPEPAPALAYAGIDASPEERKSWGIIEID